jgi:hypothetical protein
LPERAVFDRAATAKVATYKEPAFDFESKRYRSPSPEVVHRQRRHNGQAAKGKQHPHASGMAPPAADNPRAVNHLHALKLHAKRQRVSGENGAVLSNPAAHGSAGAGAAPTTAAAGIKHSNGGAAAIAGVEVQDAPRPSEGRDGSATVTESDGKERSGSGDDTSSDEWDSFCFVCKK